MGKYKTVYRKAFAEADKIRRAAARERQRRRNDRAMTPPHKGEKERR